MLTLPHMILSVILLLAIFVAIFWAVANHRRYKLNLLVAEDLDTIISALSLGGDTRLYFLLKNIRDNNNLKQEKFDVAECDI